MRILLIAFFLLEELLPKIQTKTIATIEITAIKSSNRQKHIPLNSSFSLNGTAYDNDETSTLLDILDFNLVSDPLEEVEKKEYIDSIQSKMAADLSGFEKQVLDCFIQGKSYAEISEQLDTPIKSIDNAIQRIRKKANKWIRCRSNI